VAVLLILATPKAGVAINVVLGAIGYNFNLRLNWLKLLCALFLAALATLCTDQNQLVAA
jgi:hypothetical protein